MVLEKIQKENDIKKLTPQAVSYREHIGDRRSSGIKSRSSGADHGAASVL